jgi:hypothetical protein
MDSPHNAKTKSAANLMIDKIREKNVFHEKNGLTKIVNLKRFTTSQSNT